MNTICGTWKVSVVGLTIFRALNVFGDIKHIGVIMTGENEVKGRRFGHFLVLEEEGIVIFDYDTPLNKPFLRKVIDKVKRVNDNLYTGAFYYNGWRVFDFKLERVKSLLKK